MTVVVVTTTHLHYWAEVRCRTCHRLIFKWQPAGVMRVSTKCPRCGRVENLQLSTG